MPHRTPVYHNYKKKKTTQDSTGTNVVEKKNIYLGAIGATDALGKVTFLLAAIMRLVLCWTQSSRGMNQTWVEDTLKEFVNDQKLQELQKQDVELFDTMCSVIA